MSLKSILFVAITFFFLNSIHSQKEYYRHQIEIGRSAYHFGDHPMKFGKNGLGVASGFWIYFPYVSYKYSPMKKISFGLSFEDWDVIYNKKLGREAVKQIQFRSFYQSQIYSNFYFFEKNKLRIAARGIFSYRFSAREIGTHSYIDQGAWTERLSFYNNIKGFGAGFGLELDYKIYKRFSVSLKGEYSRFSDKKGKIDQNYVAYGEYPKNQLGITLVVGYSFGKQPKKKE